MPLRGSTFRENCGRRAPESEHTDGCGIGSVRKPRPYWEEEGPSGPRADYGFDVTPPTLFDAATVGVAPANPPSGDLLGRTGLG